MNQRANIESVRDKKNTRVPRIRARRRAALTLEVLEDRTLMSGSSVVGQLFIDPDNLLSDHSGEFLFNRTDGAAKIDVGDLCITSFGIGSVDDSAGGGGPQR